VCRVLIGQEGGSRAVFALAITSYLEVAGLPEYLLQY
jgi:hypothetical protein